MTEEVLVPHPGWKPDLLFGPHECVLCMDTVKADEPYICMIDCPCTLVLHTHCGIKYYWKILPRATTCPTCKATASLVLVNRDRTAAAEGQPPLSISQDVIVECEFASDAPNIAAPSDSEAEADAAAAAHAQPVVHQPPPSSEDDSEHSDHAESDSDFELFSRYVDGEAGCDDESSESSEEEVNEDSEDEASAQSTASEESEASGSGSESSSSDGSGPIAPRKRKRT